MRDSKVVKSPAARSARKTPAPDLHSPRVSQSDIQRSFGGAIANLGAARPQTWLALQRIVGNSAIQRLVENFRGQASRPPADSDPFEATERARGGGRPLDAAVAGPVSEAVGADLSPVRVHTDPAADALCQSFEARAFTAGRDIFFRGNSYRPDTRDGRQLLAHELAHVVQQGAGTSPLDRTVSQPGDIAEREADAAAGTIARSMDGGSASAPAMAGASPQPAGVLRKTAEEGAKQAAELPPDIPAGIHALIEGDAELRTLALQLHRAATTDRSRSKQNEEFGSERTALIKDIRQVHDGLVHWVSQHPGIGPKAVHDLEVFFNQKVQAAVPMCAPRPDALASFLESQAAPSCPAPDRNSPWISLHPKYTGQSVAAIEAYFFQKIAGTSPYYTQMANANVLKSSEKSADVRTCNLTTIGMSLEALGLTSADFQGNRQLMGNLAKTYGLGSLAGLRFPDFLQLLTIYLQMGGESDAAALNQLAVDKPSAFASRAESGRSKTDSLILYSDRFNLLTRQFGAKAHRVATEYNETLDLFGEFTRGVIKQEKDLAKAGMSSSKAHHQAEEEHIASFEARKEKKDLDSKVAKEDAELADLATSVGDLTGKLAAARKELDELSQKKEGPEPDAHPKGGKKHKSLEARKSDKMKQIAKLEKSLQRAEKQHEKLSGTRHKDYTILLGLEGAVSEEAREKALPLAEYKRSVLHDVSQAMASGKQVIVALRHHFVQLQSISDREIVVDDPGRSSRRDTAVTWEEARSFGYFLAYIVVDR